MCGGISGQTKKVFSSTHIKIMIGYFVLDVFVLYFKANEKHDAEGYLLIFWSSRRWIA